MKSNSKMMKFVAIVLLVTVVSIILVSGTFAKYTTSGDGTGTAYVAKWNITLDGNKLDDATFSVFDTVLDSDVENAETDVVTESGKTIIAPGTSGKFTLLLANNSDVTAQVSIALTEAEGNADIPIEFSATKDGTYYTDLADVFKGDDYKIAAGGTLTPTVYWRWAFEGTSSTNYTDSQTDKTDTTLGEASYTTKRTQYDVTVTVTATQVD